MVDVYKMDVKLDEVLNRIRYGKLKKGIDTNIMPLYLTHETTSERSHLYVQTPKVQIKTNVIENDVTQNFMDVISHDENFTDEIQRIENRILCDLKSNKETFFANKGIDDIFLEAGQTSNVTKEGVCKLRIMKDLKVWNHQKDVQLVNTLMVGKIFTGIIQVVGVWFTTSRWGVTLKLVQARHTKEKIESRVNRYMFPDENESDVDEDDDQTIMSPPP